MQIKQNLKIILTILIIIGVLTTPFFVWQTQAQENFNVLKIYNSQNFVLENSFDLPKESTSYFMDTLDLGGDGQSEIVLSAGFGQKPWVKILRSDGSLINEFLAYAEEFTGGVEVKGCDLDGDGKSEIVTGAHSNGGSHIRIFDGYGKTKINSGFFFSKDNFNTGVQIGCADINGDKQDEILAVSGEYNSEKELKVFNAQGEELASQKIGLKGKNIKLSRVDLGGDGIDEILVSGGWQDKPIVKIYRGDLSLINSFYAYDENFTGGVNVIGFDIDQDNQDEIITVPQVLGGPHLRIFDGYGNEKITSNTFIFDNKFLGGLNLSVGNLDKDDQNEIVFAPQILPTANNDFTKYIDVDVSEQTFSCYQNGYLLGKFLTSTGKPSTPTRLGEFTVFSKYEMAYGYADGVKWSMPYFIGFYTSGNLENGIHELPFLNGAREGTFSLGKAVSHGCVRLRIGAAKEVYDWVEINNTKVIVHK